MNKPAGYEEAQVLGEYTPINLGGQKLVIMQVEEVTASNGNQYLKILFDTAKDDVQPSYYSKRNYSNYMYNTVLYMYSWKQEKEIRKRG